MLATYSFDSRGANCGLPCTLGVTRSEAETIFCPTSHCNQHATEDKQHYSSALVAWVQDNSDVNLPRLGNHAYLSLRSSSRRVCMLKWSAYKRLYASGRPLLLPPLPALLEGPWLLAPFLPPL